jgi:mRNA-degrading endonuclease RelE of RelBE toxin-antitoxin system
VLVAIERDPFCGKKLSGELRGLFSFRAWPYRILYQIQRGLLLVIVISVGQRKDVYR